MRRLLPFAAAACLVAACGTRGPLVLPPAKPQPTTTAPSAPADHSSKPANANGAAE